MIGWQAWTNHEQIVEAYGFSSSVHFYAASWADLVYQLRGTITFARAEDMSFGVQDFPVEFNVSLFEFVGRPSKELLLRCLNHSGFKKHNIDAFPLLIDENLKVTPPSPEPWCAECESDAKDHGKFYYRTNTLLCERCTTAADARRRLERVT